MVYEPFLRFEKVQLEKNHFLKNFISPKTVGLRFCSLSNCSDAHALSILEIANEILQGFVGNSTTTSLECRWILTPQSPRAKNNIEVRTAVRVRSRIEQHEQMYLADTGKYTMTIESNYIWTRMCREFEWVIATSKRLGATKKQTQQQWTPTTTTAMHVIFDNSPFLTSTSDPKVDCVCLFIVFMNTFTSCGRWSGFLASQ